LNQLLDDRQLRKRMSAAAVARAQGFSWDRIARQIVAVYQEVASIKEP
jgi:glycosyltransferase involved in cell wall biosynthesis